MRNMFFQNEHIFSDNIVENSSSLFIKNQKVNMRKKTRNCKNGFTLAETLLAVLILLMVSGIVAAGVPAAKNAYEKVVLASNAQILLSTTVAELRDEIGTAWGVEVKDGKVYYFSASTGAKTVLSVEGDPESIQIKDYAFSIQDEADGDDDPFGKRRPLVSNSAASKNIMYAFYDSVDMSENVVQFHNLKVYLRSNKHELAAYGNKDGNTLSIRAVKALKDE